MQNSSPPALFPIPFAASGTRNVIPTPTQVPTSPGSASLTTGFPPAGFIPVASGGIPPAGADMNGILYMATAANRWNQAGGFYQYSASFAASIGGYPQGAKLLNATGTGYWVSGVDNNQSNPDTSGLNWTAEPMVSGQLPLRGLRVAMFGDSINDVLFQKISANLSGGLTVTGGVGTFTSAALTFAYPKNWVKLYNIGDPTLGIYINNAMVEVISAPNGHSFTFSTVNPATGLPMADGDYSNQAGQPWIVTPLTIMCDQSWFAQMNYLTGGHFEIVANYSFSGQTTPVFDEYVGKIFTGPKFDLAVISIGEADYIFTTTVGPAITAAIAAYANIQPLLALFQAQGIPQLFVIPPGVSNTVGSQPHVQVSNLAGSAYRNALVNLKRDRGQYMRLADVQAAIFDGTVVNGDISAVNTGDGLHPSSQGALAAGALVANSIRDWLPQVNLLDGPPIWIGEDTSTYSQPGSLYGNLAKNGLMVGTGGTVTGPATGTAPTGWVCQWSGATGTSLAFAGNVARTVTDNIPQSALWGFGMTANAVFSGAQTFIMASPDFAGQMVPNDLYQYKFGITVVALADTVNLANISVNFQLLNGGSLNGLILNQLTVPGTTTYNLKAGQKLDLIFPPFRYGTGQATLTNAFFIISVSGAGAGSANLEFSNLFVRLMDPSVS